MDTNPNEKAHKTAEEALSRLAADLERGHSDTLKAYLATMSRFHHYSWGNVLLIHAQRPGATRVAGFHTWHDLGRSVKKGEKGIMIFAPVVVKNEAPPGQEPSKDPFRLAGFRTGYVFDVAQTEGQPLPEFAATKGDPKDHLDKLRETVAKRGIALEYDKSIAPAQGVSTGGRIRLMPELPSAEEFAVLAHELAHEMLHHGNDRGSLPKVVRETQAEAVAFVVCRGVGLETNTAAADYIALYNGDKGTLAKSLAVIQETSAKILGELFPDERGRAAQARESESPARGAVSPHASGMTPPMAPQEPTIPFDR